MKSHVDEVKILKNPGIIKNKNENFTLENEFNLGKY